MEEMISQFDKIMGYFYRMFLNFNDLRNVPRYPGYPGYQLVATLFVRHITTSGLPHGLQLLPPLLHGLLLLGLVPLNLGGSSLKM